MGIRQLRNRIGKKLKSMRKNEGISQEKLAEYVNMSREHISCVECGKYLPTVETLYNFSQHFKIDIREFFG